MSPEEKKRLLNLQLREDHIGRHLAESEKTGELKSAPSYGKPLDLGDGYEQTPPEFRMPFKVLKDAGVLPAEVELMQTIAKLQAEADASTDADAAKALQQRISELRQALALRLEHLRSSGSL